jgi:hypothetical protein
MFPTGFIGVCRLGSEKLFLGVLTKNKIFYQLSFLEFYANSEFLKKKEEYESLIGRERQG